VTNKRRKKRMMQESTMQKRMLQDKISRRIPTTRKGRKIWKRGRRQWSMMKTSMTQKSRMTVNTTEHQKKLRRRRQIRRKTKNTRLKKIWQRILGRRGSREPKDSRKQKERAKEKKKIRQVTR
jgi:hypothetical protein